MKLLKTVITLAVIAFSITYTVAQNQKPNIVIINMDDMGYQDLGCFGAPKNQTPNIDKMADEGVRFTNFYAGSNICSPSRASLLTGCYPPRVGMPKVLLDTPKGLSFKAETIAELLKKNGYATALVGKWHLGHYQEFLPTRHGFDYFYGTPFSHDMKVEGGLPFYEGEKVLEYNPDITQLTTRYTKKAKQYINENKDKPFFLYLAHNMPHTPLAVSKKFAGQSGSGLYADVMMELDWSVGEVLKELKKLGLEKNTLVVLSSDNGPSLKQGKHAGDAGVFREGKGTTFEGGHRVPGIFYMPGTISKGKEFDDMVSQLDVFPTVAHITGTELPEYKIDGVNLWETLTKGEKHSRKEFFYFNAKNIEAYRKGNVKYHKAHKYRANGEKKSDGKYKVVSKQLEESVFDLSKDAGESKNILHQKANLAKKYKNRMQTFNKKLKSQKFSAEIKEGVSKKSK